MSGRRAFARGLAVLWGMACILSSPARAAGPSADKRLHYLVPFIRRHDLPVTLGPTGAWGYVCRNWIVVKGIHPGSPARDVLQRWDILIGANGRPFREDEDPRMALGRAVTDAEAGRAGGVLRLTLVREGVPREVEIPLRVLGPYSPTWPFECRKSQTILAEACRYVADQSVPDRGTTGHREFNALLLLASGNIEYLDIVRRTVYRVVDDPLTGGYQGWSRSFAGMLLGEYYLATGDPTVFPKLGQVAESTAAGQMLCGSWGHRMPWDGYGAVNQIGLMCFISLALFQEAGVAVDPAAMKRSSDFFAKYAGRGWVPYGDHVPWRGTSGNGKNGSAAVVFDLLGGHEEAVGEFATTVAASYRYREVGHTGAFFSFVWGPPGAARAPRRMLQQFADEQAWYYDLSRTHEGGLVCQPNPENLSGRTPGLYTLRGPQWTTGGMATLYALPTRGLRILGGQKGIFSLRPPPSLEQAFALWKAKKWSQAAEQLRAFLAKPGTPEAERAFAQGLLRAHERMEKSVALTLKAAEANAAKGDVFLASEQARSLRRLVAEDRPPLVALEKRLEGEAVAREIKVGQEYVRARGSYTRHTRAWRTIENLAKRDQSYYGRLAAQAIKGAQPPPSPPKWTTILPSLAREASEWRVAQWDGDAPPPELAEWSDPDCDDLVWQTGSPPFQPGGRGTKWSKQNIAARVEFTHERTDAEHLAIAITCPVGTEVYLNGYRVLEIVSTPRKPLELVPLHDKAPELLRKGRNVLAVAGRKGRTTTLDVGLRAAYAK